ncbi:MAG: polysaccharide biosynthesis protein [Desulfobacula sp.]|uniref:polysaccharide biosynthesis protein n=1 Tax=Desulfobacula sp. TaxID=2593537 RepID=UPI0039B972C6|nr:polysaccharide biosynthesis protein [Desulfobacula sp.]
MEIRVSRNLYIILTIDVILLLFSFYVAHLIRFDFMIPEWALEKFFNMLPYVLVVKTFCFYFFDLYRGMWRYTSLNDLLNVVKASTIAELIVIVIVLYVNRFQDVSRSVFIIDWCLTLIFIAALRVMTRIIFEQFTENISFQDLKEIILNIFKIRSKNSRGVIIIGAGDCGEKICREIREDASLKYHVDGFLDDDLSKIGRKIHGISVLDKIEGLSHAIKSTESKEAIIAIPSLKVEKMRQIVNICREADIIFKTVPSMGELINGKVTINLIRDVEYRDLLGRDPVDLEKEKIGQYLGKKKVIVTGGGGSIGRELCKQICKFNPEKIILFERAETPLYEIDLELKKDFPDIEILPILGDIQNKDEIESVFKKYAPDIIFHAAAYKHVPMLEHHPWKAVENNIIGTENLVDVALQFQSEKFVLISTDKAVNPANVMGASKRIAEMILQHSILKKDLKTSFITVRFGNVIGSAGSVIPLFKQQIKQGGPVTVTHPDIIRYFMLIPEACQLILQAGAMGKGGEIYVLEMGRPVNISDMAKDLIRFSGFEPDGDIEIKYIGLRPGEKLYEELITKDEFVVPTSHAKIMVLNSENINFEKFNPFLKELKQLAADQNNNEEIKHMLKKIVPEYQPKEL